MYDIHRLLCAAMTCIVWSLTMHGVHAAPVQWGDNGHWYEVVESEPLSWADAKVAATMRPRPNGTDIGHLVTIGSEAENSFLLSNFPMSRAWIGFTDETIEGEWRWIDDTAGVWQDPVIFASPVQSAYVNWDTDEPNNQIKPEFPNGEDYAEWIGGFNGRWNDGTGPTGTTNQWVVEYDSLPEPPLGDYNGDGAADGADYVYWRKLVGHLVPACSGPDVNCNGFVEFNEDATWREHFGETPASSGGSNTGKHIGQASNIPEPSALTLAALLIFGAVGCSPRTYCVFNFFTASRRF